jgi:arginase
MKYILPNPFNLSPYGQDSGEAYKAIVNLNGANPNAESHFPSNQILDNCTILDPVQFSMIPVGLDDVSLHPPYALEMQSNSIKPISILDKDSQLLVIGGDHTVSIGTGAGLAQILDMSKVGLIWVDAHGDFNTPSTSSSKSLTGYPCAINMGLGEEQYLKSFNNNFIQSCVQIGIRDIDQQESQNLQSKNVQTFSNLDIEEFGIKRVVEMALEYLCDCDYIWLSLDIDSLDPIYCDNGRTDVPVVGGLTPRELMYITSTVEATQRLKVTEIVQINSVPNNTNLIYLANRLIELAFGLGRFRTNEY